MNPTKNGTPSGRATGVVKVTAWDLNREFYEVRAGLLSHVPVRVGKFGIFFGIKDVV